MLYFYKVLLNFNNYTISLPGQMIRKNFVIRSLVAPCYSKPSFSSAKITEAVFGETVEVLEVKDSWIHIKQKDDYKSWLKNLSH